MQRNFNAQRELLSMSDPTSHDISASLYDLPLSGLEAGGDFSMHAQPLLGDYYCEGEDTMRGVTLASVPAVDLEQAKLIQLADDDAHDAFPVASSWASEKLLQKRQVSGTYEKRHAAGVNLIVTDFEFPPPLPAHSFFVLAVTTLYFACSAFSESMKELCERLRGSMRSSITKVNTKKCTIKADVFIHGTSVNIKIRCYHMEYGSLPNKSRIAVEVQRRGGDAVAFAKVYSVLACREATIDYVPCLDCELAVNDIENVCTPLFDMAKATCKPQLQAESSAALYKKATDLNGIDFLRTDELGEVLIALLEATRSDVEHYTAMLLQVISKRQEFGKYFGVKLLASIFDKVISVSSTPYSQQVFAEVFQAAILNFASVFSDEHSSRLKDLVAGALRTWDFASNTLVHQMIQQAYDALQLRSDTLANAQLFNSAKSVPFAGLVPEKPPLGFHYSTV